MTTTLLAPTTAYSQQTPDDLGAAVGEALRKLNDVGSEYDIALYLENHGIRGRRTSSASCPVAMYILAVTGIQVSIDSISFGIINDDTRACLGVWTAVPDNVGVFICSFDSGHYPELVADERFALQKIGGEQLIGP